MNSQGWLGLCEEEQGAGRCWYCGVEPDEVFDDSRLGSAESRYISWPAGDHPHAEAPPSPGQLAQAGHEALMRIMGIL